MPVLEEAKTMVYVTNHNMITMAMAIFKTYKMADKGEELAAKYRNCTDL